jgi:signal transduction histidine kinase
MAASSLLLLRISEYLRTRKSAIAADAAAGCHDEGRARGDHDRRHNDGEDGHAKNRPPISFPWAQQLETMIQGTADTLLSRTANDQSAPASTSKGAPGVSGDLQLLLSDAWLVRNSFLRALNRFQGEQAGKVDYTAIEMTEARQDAVQEFDRQISAALSDWIAGAKHKEAIPADSVRDLRDGMRAIQGLLQLAIGSIPPAARTHVTAAAQQLGRLSNIAHELVESGPSEEGAATAIVPPTPPPAAPRAQGTLAIAPLDVGSFVRALAEAARPAAQKYGLRVESRCLPGPAMLRTDGAKLHRAATLLINFAISVTDRGGLTISSAQAGTGEWNLEIRDTSAGVPPEILLGLLKGVAHSPNDAATVNDSRLGIALARDLVEILGGQLQASSAAAEGNRFVIALPTG